MPKPLHNQTLIDTPEEQDRLAFGQPNVEGGKNVTWRRTKELLASTENEIISDPATESLDGLGQTQQNINRDNVSAIFAIRDAIRQVAGAAATFEADPKPQTINVAETSFTFIEAIPSTNPDIIEVDSLNNQVTIKQKGIFQFATFLNVENQPPGGDKNLTLRTKNAANDVIITERTLIIPNAGYSGTSTFTFEPDEADLPLTLDFYLEGDDAGMVLNELQSTILTGAQVNTSGGLGIVGYETNVAIRAITGYAAGNDALNLLNGKWYKFDPAETATDDDDTYLTPNDITEPAPGRWVKKQDFAIQDDIKYLYKPIINADITSSGTVPIDTYNYAYEVQCRLTANTITLDCTVDKSKAYYETSVLVRNDTTAGDLTINITGIDNFEGGLSSGITVPNGEKLRIKIAVFLFNSYAYIISEGGGQAQSVEKTPSSTVSIQELLAHTLPINQNGIINFVGGTNTFIGGTHQRIINTDGSAINFDSSFFPAFKNDYSTLEAGSYYFLFWLIPTNSGNKIGVNISKINEDLTAPELQSATVEDATDNVMNQVFDEAVNITTTGWSLSTDNPTPLNINSVVGSGTATPDFNLDRSVIEGEVITLNYDSSTGNTTDANGNPLADIVNFSVTNNVTNLIQLAAPVANTPTMGSSSAILTWSAVTNNSGYDVYYREVGSGTWLFFETTGIDTETSTVTGLSPATNYEFYVVTKGDGVTYSDSIPSNTVSGTTSAAFNPVTEAYQFLDATILAGADTDPVATLDDQSPNNRDASTVGAATPIIDERTINAQTIKTITLNGNQYAYDLGVNLCNQDHEIWMAMELLDVTGQYTHYYGGRGTPNTNRLEFGDNNGDMFSLVGNPTNGNDSGFYNTGYSGFVSHKVFRYVVDYTNDKIDLYIDNVFQGSNPLTAGFGANMAVTVNSYLGAQNNEGTPDYTNGSPATSLLLTRMGLYNRVLTTEEATEVFNYMEI